jgi:hypothetical protein
MSTLSLLYASFCLLVNDLFILRSQFCKCELPLLPELPEKDTHRKKVVDNVYGKAGYIPGGKDTTISHAMSFWLSK